MLVKVSLDVLLIQCVAFLLILAYELRPNNGIYFV